MNVGDLIQGSDMQSCTLIGEYADTREGDYYIEKYFFGRPWEKSDYVITKIVLLTKNDETNSDDIPF